MAGDPGFEAANLFYNPLERDDLCLDRERIAGMAGLLSRSMGESPGRLLDHGFAYGCLSAAWHEADGDTGEEGRTLQVAHALRAVRRAF